MAKVNPIPQGLRTLTPQLSVTGCAEAIEFWKKAFGAEERNRAPDPSGKKVWHAELRIGDSAFFTNDTFPDMPGSKIEGGQLWIYVDGVDAAFKRAVDAGAKVVMPLADMFWGDRSGTVLDKWNVQWTISQHVKDMTQDEMMKAGQEFAKQQARK